MGFGEWRELAGYAYAHALHFSSPRDAAQVTEAALVARELIFGHDSGTVDDVAPTSSLTSAKTEATEASVADVTAPTDENVFNTLF